MAAKKATASLVDASVNELTKAAESIGKALDQIEAIVASIPVLSIPERKASLGRLRQGEAAIIKDLCDVIDAFPTHFVAVAAQDRGKNDDVVETEPTRTDLARRAALEGTAARAQAIAVRLSDAMLILGHRIREVSIPAYRVGQNQSALDPKLRGKMVPVIEFYQSGVRKAVATKKKNAKTKTK